MSARTTSSSRLLLAAAIALALVGCGGASPGTTQPPSRLAEIDRIRAHAAAHPDDAEAQRTLAEWELFGDGGDPDRVEAAIARAEELAPHDVALAYMRGVLLEQRGRPDEALESFLAVLERAPGSDDPMVPFYAESSFAYIADVRTNTPRLVERARPVIAALVAEPGRIGLPARLQGFYWLRDVALQRGDVAEARRLEALVGCPTAARVAGPFGPSVLAGFDETLPAEGRGPLGDRYDLGPGRGPTPTRNAEVRSCAVSLGGRGTAGGPGTRIVESTLHAAEAGRHVLALVSSGSVQIRLDGEVVARVDRRRTVRGPTTFHVLELSAGDHELELKVSDRDGQPRIGWVVDRAIPGYDPELGVAIPADTARLVERFAVLDVLSLRKESVEARERLREVGLSERSTATMLALAARIVADDPFLSETRREDDQRRLVAAAAARDPHAVWPAVRLAALETGEVEAIAAMREVAERFPRLATVQLALAAALDGAGFDADAEQALARAEAAQPEACSVVEARYGAAAQRGRVDEANRLARALVACDARNETVFDRALAAHDWATARAELERLRPLVTPGRARVLALRLARASGDATEEARIVGDIERDARPEQVVVTHADRRYRDGDREGALRAIRAEAARSPRDAHDLRRLELALSGEDVMQAYRVDGREVIRRFEASGRSYAGESAVLVFDYEVTRLFEDGSALDLIHQIYRIQTQEGIERFSELRLQGRVLTARVVSSDGRVREPDQFQGRVSLPPLSIGDYVEYEVVRDVEPRWRDAYLSGGWVFQSYSQPFDHSEIVYVVPVGMDVRFDVRGPVPAPEVREENGLRVHRFLMTEQPARTREPRSVPSPAILPSLRASARLTWERMFQGIYDQLLDLDPEDPAAARLLAREILGGEDGAPRERVRRIHRWVMENVEEVDDSFFGSAPVMLAERAGSQARVLRYLLRLAGIPAEIAFARTLTGEPPSPDVPSTSTYGAIVVAVQLEERPLYLFAGGRGVPHDQLPGALLGQEAVVLAPGLPRVTLPTEQGPRPRLRVTADLVVEATGRARGRAIAAFSGAAGADVRNAIRQVPPAERARIIAERFTPSIVPGGLGDPATVVVRGLDDWEQPLEIQLDVVSDALLRGTRESFSLVPMTTSGIESELASLPTRTTTELVGEVDVVLELRVRGPGVVRAPEPARLIGPAGASATLEVAREPDGAVRLSRRVHVPMATVPAEQYPELARFCRAVTELENRTVGFEVR